MDEVWPEPPTTLVISGGGIKGLAFFGALKALQESRGWDFGRGKPRLQTLCGVSIGAFLALLLILQFSVDELLSMARFLDMSTWVSLRRCWRAARCAWTTAARCRASWRACAWSAWGSRT